MKLRADNPPDTINVPHAQEFSLNVGETEFIDVASMNEWGGNNRISLGLARSGISGMQFFYDVPRGDYEIEVTATAEEGTPYAQRFSLYIDEVGRLCMKATTP